MKVLWLCNFMLPAVAEHLQQKAVNKEGWISGMAEVILRRYESNEIRLGLAFPVSEQMDGYREVLQIFGGELTCYGFYENTAHPECYDAGLEERMHRIIADFAPDVIHSWGVEYDHALAMVNAAQAEGMLDRTVASIQGLCGFIAEHYTDGLPVLAVNHVTFRDFVRKDNIRQQQEKFFLRGKLEAQILGKLRHVIGRTSWDYARVKELNPDIEYHFCNETLRPCFYEDQWGYNACRKHSVFASSCSYPVKGFHYLLEAMARVRKIYPDAAITVTGSSYLGGNWKSRLRRGSYEAYLAKLTRKYRLENAVQFLGDLSADEMKQAFLRANVFVLPSTMENSPNSLGEAMLLGVPCVAADVGGVRNLMNHGTEGMRYTSGDVKALAEHILRLFALEAEAARLGEAARSHARLTHDPETNLEELMNIYREIQ